MCFNPCAAGLGSGAHPGEGVASLTRKYQRGVNGHSTSKRISPRCEGRPTSLNERALLAERSAVVALDYILTM